MERTLKIADGANTPLRVLAFGSRIRAMQRTAFHPHLGPTDLEPNPIFNVVIAYEDLETGKHAKETCDFLAEHLGAKCRLVAQMWKFGVLGLPQLREAAAKDAAQADLIIVASHGGSGLPAEVKDWFEQWLPRKGEAIALVALFDTALARTEAAEATRAYLANVARRAHIDFFAQPDQGPGGFRDRGRFVLQPPLAPDEAAVPRFTPAPEPDLSFPHWGINE